MCRIIFFLHHEAGRENKGIADAVKQHLPDIPLDICPTVDAFQAHLRHPDPRPGALLYLILADSLDRLGQLLPLAGLLEGKRLVLILPDSRKSTRSSASRLWPRYMTDVDGNRSDLCAVLGKMAGSGLSEKSDTP